MYPKKGYWKGGGSLGGQIIKSQSKGKFELKLEFAEECGIRAENPSMGGLRFIP